MNIFRIIINDLMNYRNNNKRVLTRTPGIWTPENQARSYAGIEANLHGRQ